MNDESTVILMTDFYRRLNEAEKGGLEPGDVSRALRESTKDLIDYDPTYRHPFYWALFVTIGEP